MKKKADHAWSQSPTKSPTYKMQKENENKQNKSKKTTRAPTPITNKQKTNTQTHEHNQHRHQNGIKPAQKQNKLVNVRRKSSEERTKARNQAEKTQIKSRKHVKRWGNNKEECALEVHRGQEPTTKACCRWKTKRIKSERRITSVREPPPQT